MIRLLIVDDQPAIRRGLRMLLTAESDLSVVGETSEGEAALDLASSLHPDVVLMDVELPHMNGIAATRAIQAIRPPVAVIILSIHDDALTQARAAEAGAAAFVTKSMPAETLLTAIRRVAQQPGGPGSGRLKGGTPNQAHYSDRSTEPSGRPGLAGVS
jgi:DNA-binding NarL/FixJ family response regulator